LDAIHVFIVMVFVEACWSEVLCSILTDAFSCFRIAWTPSMAFKRPQQTSMVCDGVSENATLISDCWPY